MSDSSNLSDTTASESLSNSSSNDILELTTFELMPLEWTWGMILLSIILGLIIIGTILGNSLVLFVFFKRLPIRLPSHFFIANLAAADLLVAGLCLPFTATLQVTGRWYFGELGYTLWTIGHLWFCSSSILSMCAVSFERYVGVKYPLDHANIMSRTRLLFIIALVWIISGCLTFWSVFGWYEELCEVEQLVCRQNLQLGHVLVVVIGMMYIPIIIMSFFYSSIYITATVHMKLLKAKSRASCISASVKKSRKSPEDDRDRLSITSVTFNTELSNLDVEDLVERGLNETSSVVCVEPSKENTKKPIKESVVRRKIRDNSSRKQINLAKRLSILVGIVILCYFPYNTILLARTIKENSIDILYYNVFKWLRYFNSFANPIIYALAMPAYSLAIRSTLIRIRGKLFPYA